MKGVFLDSDSIAPSDLDLNGLTQQLDEWRFYPSTTLNQCLERVLDADVIVTNKIRLDAATLSQCPHLKLILVAATGVNNVDLAAAEAQGIAVANVSGYGSETVAQHTFALLLALSNRIREYSEEAVNGRWAQNHFFCLLHHPMMELHGKTLVLIGYGAIGQAVARIAKGFGMQVKVAASLRTNQPQDSEREPLALLLPQADILSLHCPLTPETEHLIDAKALAQMKPSALLLNVSRGGIVDETALAEALRSGTIAGAALDVLSQEPPAAGNPLLDQMIPNLLLTPHCAWGTNEARQRLVDEMALNLKAFLSGAARNRLV